jgi:UDP-N-acetyl-D-mannosaminuronate dehydrogenase
MPSISKLKDYILMKMAIAGTGYVGLSNAVLLAQHNTVIALDLIADKIEMLNNRQSPIANRQSPIANRQSPITNHRFKILRLSIFYSIKSLI